MTEDNRKYSRRELRCLWAGFAGEPDEAERLAGFADCDVKIAAEMIKSLRETAASRRAAEAEEARKQKPPRKKKDPVTVEDGEITEVSEPFPTTDIVAAAVNSAHGYSIIEASGMAFGRRKSVIVEKIGHRGQFFHRLKVTTYNYYETKEQAIAAAKQHRLKLTLFDDLQ